jgi:hypothetical protein
MFGFPISAGSCIIKRKDRLKFSESILVHGISTTVSDRSFFTYAHPILTPTQRIIH